MTFIWPSMLFGLLVVPVLIIAYILLQRRRSKYALRYASLSLVKEALGKGPGIRRHIPAALFLASLTVMIFALARPAAYITLPVNQGTIILTFDISGSMRATDMQPNRLEAAKAAGRAFVENQPESVKIGVVSFSEHAMLIQTPTYDREAIQAAINRLTPQQGTAVGSGILVSLDAIFEPPMPNTQQSQMQAQQRQSFRSEQSIILPTPTPSPTPVAAGAFNPAIIVLLSDGESNRGPKPLDIVNQAVDRGIRVYTVGIGNPEGAILSTMGRSMRVRLDEETMKRIAARTDGVYFRADNETDLKSIYQDLSRKLVLRPERTELTALFTGSAVILMLLAGTLSLLWFSRLP